MTITIIQCAPLFAFRGVRSAFVDLAAPTRVEVRGRECFLTKPAEPSGSVASIVATGAVAIK